MLDALGLNLKEIIFAMVNFLILVFVLGKFIYKPFLGMLENRKQMIQEKFDRADAVNKRADARMAKYNRQIAGAEEESREIIRDAKQKAEAQAQAIIDEAKAEAAEIIAKAERTIEMEQAKAIEGLHNEIAELALLAAEQIVGDKIEDAGQEAIVDRVIRNAREAEWQN
ncbi:MAG: F0F1 ATP synthase subunit B [Bacillota bacterium]|nr:F0F1 ATP synthase subunit B [Clostridiales bacterium]MDD6765174.1 F0F1 ATP synthase subunit B [Bacillota bacterium]MDY5606775.1 F0F1 ATP synthase subunit B [Lentihominibacter sp.]MCI7392038.1 F0F1 ATP synthase subunit B [Clostridiales bacterium]MDD6979925.1 F0F1 ATP synthase subunit B [Bacillota bacterium]